MGIVKIVIDPAQICDDRCLFTLTRKATS